MSEEQQAQKPMEEEASGCRKVAIAIDGSDNSKWAFHFYVDNIRKPGDKVYLISSVEINTFLHSPQWENFYVNNVRKAGDKVYLIHSVEINSVLHSTQWYSWLNEITLLDSIVSAPYTFDKDVLMKLLEDEKDKIRHKLEGYATLLKESAVDGTVKSVHAESAGEGIVKAAQEVNAALIVVGTRGLGKLRRTFMGSVSDYVLHHAHVPVLVCRHEDH